MLEKRPGPSLPVENKGDLFSTKGLPNKNVLPTPENESNKPTQEQLIIAHAGAYLDYLKIVNSAASHYADWQTNSRNGRYPYASPRQADIRRHREQALVALDDLYFLRLEHGSEEAAKIFSTEWDEVAAPISQTLDRFMPKIQEAQANRLNNAAQLSDQDMDKQRKEIIQTIARSTSDQVQTVEELSGLSPKLTPEQRSKLRAELIKTAVKGGILLTAMYGGSDYLSDTIGLSVGPQFELFSNSYTDPRVLVAIGAAEFAYYGTEILKYLQTNRMVKDEKMTVYHPLAKFAHDLAAKTTTNEKTINTATLAGYLSNPWIWPQYAKWYGALLVSPSVFVAGDVAATALNVAHLAGVELEHWRVHRNDKKSQEGVKAAPPAPDQIIPS